MANSTPLSRVCHEYGKENCSLDCSSCGWNPVVASKRLHQKYSSEKIKELKQTSLETFFGLVSEDE